nr:hypothetical protein KPHV_00310 [Kitasatospora purpeofusca]BEK71222.1 hypothetical protein KPHV_84490 [Kitasatospora purpeofusca]
MDVLHERCAGVDVSKTDCKVAIRVPGRGVRPHREVRTFSAMTDDLLALRDWLVDNGITVVGMEATGAYWKPLYYLLEATDGIEPWLLNAQHMKAVPGRKTDVKDSQWICRLVEHGLSAWHMLSTDTPYRDLGPEHFTDRLGKTRQTRRLVAQLAALGYDVDLHDKPTPTIVNPG